MKQKLRIGIAEYDIIWEDRDANYEVLDAMTKDSDLDLILLPEMFSTGFTMNPETVSEPSFGPSFEWMKQKANQLDCGLAGSVSTRADDGRFVNRLYFVTPDAHFFYDKKHLFGYGRETEAYSPGDRIRTVLFRGWKFRLIVCYDLRFPVWCRNTDDYDVLLCPANWPETRIEAWESLLKARAIENMAYTIGINRTGTDGYHLKYNGHSKLFDPLGTDRTPTAPKNELIRVELDYEQLVHSRSKFGFLKDRDDFKIMPSVD